MLGICRLGFFLALLLYQGACGANHNQPNIIFILADDFGFNDIGYHAKDHQSDIKTPFLDELAAKGIKLENYYVQSVCTPTRSQLMSGRYQIHTGLQHSVIFPSQPNALPIQNKILPQQLKNCGYGTHMVGKWHLGFYESKFLPWKRGFDTYFGFLAGGEDYFTHHRCFRALCGVDMHSSEDGPVNKTWGEYSAHLFARKAIKAVDSRDPSKPFFLYLAYQSVHSPLEVPEKYLEPFRHIKDTARRIYAGMVLAMDESIYNLTQHLQELGLLDNTIIVFSTDNGGQTLEGGNNWPLRGRKNTLWEGGVRGAGFIYGKPLGVEGITHKGLLHVSDWFPTLLGAAKCSKINGTQPLDGFDQWDAIRQKIASRRTEILHNIDPLDRSKKVVNCTSQVTYPFDTRVRAAIRSGPWKLLTGNPGFDKWVRPPESRQNETDSENGATHSKNLIQLFNIEMDPYEHNDVASVYPAVVEDLLLRLEKYNSTAVPVQFPPYDPNANPKHRGGFWGPWKDKYH